VLTGGEPAVLIRTLSPSDGAAAHELARAEGWNQTAEDWGRVQRLSPDGCFGAYAAETLVGTVTTVTYGGSLAWLGMMVVNAAYRGRGVGRRLMEAALTHCTACGVETVKLDATPAGKPLYESLGFAVETTVERWEGIARPSGAPEQGIRSPGPPRLDELVALDRQAFGADRRSLVEELIAQRACEAAAIRFSTSDRVPTGYALARRGRRAAYVGPLMAADRATARTLLDDLFVRLEGRALFLDWMAGPHGAPDFLLARGWKMQRSLARMARGRPSGAGLSPRTFAIAGPELG